MLLFICFPPFFYFLCVIVCMCNFTFWNDLSLLRFIMILQPPTYPKYDLILDNIGFADLTMVFRRFQLHQISWNYESAHFVKVLKIM